MKDLNCKPIFIRKRGHFTSLVNTVSIYHFSIVHKSSIFTMLYCHRRKKPRKLWSTLIDVDLQWINSLKVGIYIEFLCLLFVQYILFIWDFMLWFLKCFLMSDFRINFIEIELVADFWIDVVITTIPVNYFYTKL